MECQATGGGSGIDPFCQGLKADTAFLKILDGQPSEKQSFSGDGQAAGEMRRQA